MSVYYSLRVSLGFRPGHDPENGFWGPRLPGMATNLILPLITPLRVECCLAATQYNKERQSLFGTMRLCMLSFILYLQTKARNMDHMSATALLLCLRGARMNTRANLESIGSKALSFAYSNLFVPEYRPRSQRRPLQIAKCPPEVDNQARCMVGLIRSYTTSIRLRFLKLTLNHMERPLTFTTTMTPVHCCPTSRILPTSRRVLMTAHCGRALKTRLTTKRLRQVTPSQVPCVDPLGTPALCLDLKTILAGKSLAMFLAMLRSITQTRSIHPRRHPTQKMHVSSRQSEPLGSSSSLCSSLSDPLTFSKPSSLRPQHQDGQRACVAPSWRRD